jgi:hypothetical protein
MEVESMEIAAGTVWAARLSFGGVVLLAGLGIRSGGLRGAIPSLIVVAAHPWLWKPQGQELLHSSALFGALGILALSWSHFRKSLESDRDINP